MPVTPRIGRGPTERELAERLGVSGRSSPAMSGSSATASLSSAPSTSWTPLTRPSPPRSRNWQSSRESGITSSTPERCDLDHRTLPPSEGRPSPRTAAPGIGPLPGTACSTSRPRTCAAPWPSRDQALLYRRRSRARPPGLGSASAPRGPARRRTIAHHVSGLLGAHATDRL